MSALLVILGLAVSPSPDLASQLSAALDQAHQCNPIAMDRRNVEPLIGLIDNRRAPLLEIVECDGKIERLKNGYAARSWAAQQCGAPVGRKLKIDVDAHDRLRRIHFICD